MVKLVSAIGAVRGGVLGTGLALALGLAFAWTGCATAPPAPPSFKPASPERPDCADRCAAANCPPGSHCVTSGDGCTPRCQPDPIQRP